MDNINNGDIVLTNNKYHILNYLNDNKKILNIKLMALKDFRDNYFGCVDEKAIYYLIKKYNYKYEIAKMYLDNFLFIDDLKKELDENNLINYNPLFKNNIKRIVIDNINIDPYIMNEIKKYDYKIIKSEINNYEPTVYECKNIEDEINCVAINIINILKNTKIDNIHLVNVGDEYKYSLKRIFKFYNIPVDVDNDYSIYGTQICKDFIKHLDITLQDAISILGDDDISNCIIDIINKYRFVDFDDTVKYCIKEELKNKKLNTNKDKKIDIESINDINNDDYYFILGFNQGIIPKVYKDEDYLNDNKKQQLGIYTSYEKNKLEKELVKNTIHQYKNIFITYKTKQNGEEYFKSSLLENTKVNQYIDEYKYSNLYNKLRLSSMLDEYIKFNIYNPNIDKLYSNYKNINYLDYDNNYKSINKDNFKKYIDNKLLLSYSSMDNYYKCGFKYYLNNILNINKYEDNFMAYIGNLFHDILSKAFKKDFNFEKEFNDYINEKEFTNKEQFFIDKLKNDLLFIIDTINKQEEYSTLDKSLYEEAIFVNKDRDIKVTFMGKIDKIKYKEDDKTIVQIVDYKTGKPSINIYNVPYGLDMQLPIYLYLIKNSKLTNIEIAGFYLQKILPNKLNYEKDKDYMEELEKKYRLEGYSNSNIDILSKLDKNYTESKVIKSMKITSKGFYKHAKVISSDDMDKLVDIVDKKIDEAIDNILDTKFDINPKRISGELVGCDYCKFKDICYRKEENIKDLDEIKDLSFLD